MNVLVDTNVLLDVLTRREPFHQDAQRIWALAERGSIRGLIAVISFPNIFYIVRRIRGRAAARQMLGMLRDTFTAVPLDDQILNQAIDSKFEDFEDAIQYFSALRAGAECIVSRNSDHFVKSDFPVLSPAEFLAAHPLE